MKHLPKLLIFALCFCIGVFVAIKKPYCINTIPEPIVKDVALYMESDIRPCIYVNDFGGSPYDDKDDSEAFEKAFEVANKIKGNVCMKGNGTWRF